MLSKLIYAILERDFHDHLFESALAGHMSHLYDNKNLSFGNIKEIFKSVSSGNIKNIQEKLDGQNIFFTFNVEQNALRFARNKGDIKQGGMSAQNIHQKWSEAPSVRDAFYYAYLALEKAIKALGATTTENIFGPKGDVWFSAEVIYSENPNVINYDRNAIVFHESGVSIFDKDGNRIQSADLQKNFEHLMLAINTMQNAISQTNWSVMGPIFINLQKALSDESINEFIAKLESIKSPYGLTDSNTIRDFISAKFEREVLNTDAVSPDDKEKIAIIFASDDLPSGKKKKVLSMVGPEIFKSQLERFFLAKSQSKIYGKIIKSLELLVHDFAVEVLNGVTSAIALHPDKEISRLRDEVKNAIEVIKQSSDEEKLRVLSQQLEKLKSLDKITASLEGITFRFKGDTYKLTGSFAPINQILGLLKYRR